MTGLWELPQWVPKKQLLVRFGEGNATEFVVDQDGIANNSDNLNEAREESNPHAENTDNDPGAGRSSRGFGRVSFSESLDRLGERLNPAIPATCASGESNVGNLLSD